jgi:glycerol-3-phosphate dehydrogenase (NAD(P)+)
MTQVAEGYYASGCINEVKARTGSDIPIADAVYRILYQNAAPAKEMRQLSKYLR